jgi:hypothetical protein
MADKEKNEKAGGASEKAGKKDGGSGGMCVYIYVCMCVCMYTYRRSVCTSGWVYGSIHACDLGMVSMPSHVFLSYSYTSPELQTTQKYE